MEGPGTSQSTTAPGVRKYEQPMISLPVPLNRVLFCPHARYNIYRKMTHTHTRIHTHTRTFALRPDVSWLRKCEWTRHTCDTCVCVCVLSRRAGERVGEVDHRPSSPVRLATARQALVVGFNAPLRDRDARTHTHERTRTTPHHTTPPTRRDALQHNIITC